MSLESWVLSLVEQTTVIVELTIVVVEQTIVIVEQTIVILVKLTVVVHQKKSLYLYIISLWVYIKSLWMFGRSLWMFGRSLWLYGKSLNAEKTNVIERFMPCLVGSIPHVIAYGMHYVVCICIPYGRMTMSHIYLVCILNIWYAFPKNTHSRSLEFACIIVPHEHHFAEFETSVYIFRNKKVL